MLGWGRPLLPEHVGQVLEGDEHLAGFAALVGSDHTEGLERVLVGIFVPRTGPRAAAGLSLRRAAILAASNFPWPRLRS